MGNRGRYDQRNELRKARPTKSIKEGATLTQRGEGTTDRNCQGRRDQLLITEVGTTEL